MSPRALRTLGLLAFSAWADNTRLAEFVVDGDTLVLEGGERVRLIGVDTPETVHPSKPVEQFGREASDFTKRMAQGKRVRIELDPEGDTRDRYGRTLAYVILPDGRSLNLEIVRHGYSYAYSRSPFSRMEDFWAAEEEAREKGRGLWAEAEPTPRLPAAGTDSCVPRIRCCRVCQKGQACGDACISSSRTCRKGDGCACNGTEVCP